MLGWKNYNTAAIDAGEHSKPTNQVIPTRHYFQFVSEVEVQVMGCHHHAILTPGESNIPPTRYVTMTKLNWLLEHKWLLEHIDLNDHVLQALLSTQQVIPYPIVGDAQSDGSHQQRFTVNLFHNSLPYNSVPSQVDFPGDIGSKYALTDTFNCSLPHSVTQVMIQMMLFWTDPVMIEVLHIRYDLSFASVGSSEYQALESCLFQSLAGVPRSIG
jgi:hypothetical protein